MKKEKKGNDEEEAEQADDKQSEQPTESCNWTRNIPSVQNKRLKTKMRQFQVHQLKISTKRKLRGNLSTLPHITSRLEKVLENW